MTRPQIVVRLIRAGLALVLSVLLAAPTAAQRRDGGGSHSRGSTGREHIRGYTRRDGTHVAPYRRNYPGEGRSTPTPTPTPRAPRSSTRSPHGPRPTVHAPRGPRASVHAPRASTPRSSSPRVRASPPTPGGRDARGRIKRSAHAKDDFMRQTGHPHGWPGHVVDHVKPLACGGADDPSNMQWQTTADAKAKDKVERKGC